MIDSVWDAPSSFSPQSVVLRRLTRNLGQLSFKIIAGKPNPLGVLFGTCGPPVTDQGKGKGKEKEKERKGKKKGM